MDHGAAKNTATLALPEADADTAASVKDWLGASPPACARWTTPRPGPSGTLDIVIFGTYQELVRGLPAWEETQWDNVWPRTEGFAFLLDKTVVLASPNAGMAVAIAPWTSEGFHRDGARFDRPGRSTLVLQRQADGRWLGLHSHMSLARGVPQESFGTRAVKAR
jgi:ketosteroid isomerase-like protein